uniref:Cytochrome c oxidase subunit 3 n=2 Tax=Tylopilus TaxID=80671 RepID=A0A8F0WN73_9AGAM|nr:cytochrome c oxidase subunit 3 [Tylopilus plumbeoviolaceoides]QWM97160.1 cytochrome c oxidase subunit 3 [Tylopilus plumbeoviolaceoides]
MIKSHNFQFFPYHLVEISPWPLVLSFALLNLTIGAVMYMQGYYSGDLILELGFILTLGGMAFWFRDVGNEATLGGHHTKQVKKGLEIGFILFVISEIFAFLSIFWAFFHSSLSPAIEIGGVWPPQGITPLNPFAIPLLNTILLVSSGAFVTYGHHALINGNRKNTLIGLELTVLFAVLFTFLQYLEYANASFSISDSVFGSAFYCSTGLHGIHVIVGTIFIIVQLVRTINYHITNSHHQGCESAILYWHFVDIVWLFLFIAVYYWGGL